MVKGVNKTVIEVNNTGNKMFERIVFFVSPEYSSMSVKRLKEVAEELAAHSSCVKRRKVYLRLSTAGKMTVAVMGAAVIIGVAAIIINFI